MEKMLIINNESATSKINIQSPVINYDLSEMKELLEKELVPYESGQVTEFKEAKKELAKLRKLKKGIDDTRIQLKNQYLKNFITLETELKALSEMVDPAIKNIDLQVKEQDQKEAQEKELLILDLIQTIKKDNLLLNLEIPFNPKWLNKTYKIKDIENEVWDFINENSAPEPTCNRLIEFKGLTKEKMLKMLDFWKSEGIDFKVL